MFFRSNDRPNNTFSPLDIYVFFSLVMASLCVYTEIWFALGCNMSIKHDARLFIFVFSSQFSYFHLLYGIFLYIYILLKPHIRIRIDFSVCTKKPTRPKYCAFCMCLCVNCTHQCIPLNLINVRASKKLYCYYSLVFTICSSFFFFRFFFVLNAT